MSSRMLFKYVCLRFTSNILECFSYVILIILPVLKFDGKWKTCINTLYNEDSLFSFWCFIVTEYLKHCNFFFFPFFNSYCRCLSILVFFFWIMVLLNEVKYGKITYKSMGFSYGIEDNKKHL
jgi:hypothetical protein